MSTGMVTANIFHLRIKVSSDMSTYLPGWTGYRLRVGSTVEVHHATVQAFEHGRRVYLIGRSSDNELVIEIYVGTRDLAQVRFTHDVVWETTAALNAIAFPHGHVVHKRLRGRLPRHPGFDLDHLFALAGNHSWIPDLLAPVPVSDGREPQQRLADLEGTDPAIAGNDLEQLRQLHPDSAVARMTPAQYMSTTATAMKVFWREVLEPLWDRVESIAAADIAHHQSAIARHGLGAALVGIHQRLSFADDMVRVAMNTQAAVRASGNGLWFVPSVFRWPWFAVDIREHEPVVSYAARGAGRVWEEDQRRDFGLIELLGRSRAEILRRLDVARTTTGLAQELGLSASTVSFHLSVMSASGLLVAKREGRTVLYTRALVGDLLVSGDSALARIA